MKKNIRTIMVHAACMAGLAGTFSCAKEDLSPTTYGHEAQTTAASTMAEKPAATLLSDQYLLIAATNSLPADLERQVGTRNGKITGSLKELGIATATSTDPDFARKAATIQGMRSVIRDVSAQWVEPEMQVAAEFGTPPASGDDDLLYDLQWGHDALDVPQAWNAGYRGDKARVAVLDSGFDWNHPDLKANIDLPASESFVDGEKLQYNGPNVFSHGSHTAGIIAAADNGLGVIGVAPGASLILVKVLNDAGRGQISWILEGIYHAVKQNADVINMSLGLRLPRNGKFLNNNGTPNDPSDDFVVSETKAVQEILVAFSRATTYAHQQGVTLIASGGNNGLNGNKDADLVAMPADAPHVIAISATGPKGWALDFSTNLDHLAAYSNYGTPEIDLAAPGGGISYTGRELATIGRVTASVRAFDMVVSTGNKGWYWSAGTSMAAPHVAGVAALIIGKNGGQMDPAHVETILRASADDLGKPGRDPIYGHGRVNAFRAVSSGL